MAYSILFVCLGNICRSPLAEAAFRKAAEQAGLNLHIDSAGTAAYHIGKAPDHRSIAVAAENGIDIRGYHARQLSPADFRSFTHIFALDADNLATILDRAPPDSCAEIALLLDLVPGREGQAVADPYYGDAAGFQTTWRDVSEAAQHLVAKLG